MHLTPLAHVPSWGLLDKCHQLRYSQLYALYLNEQTAFFEELLATNLLPALYHRPDRIGEDLAADLRTFEVEERRHSRWFRELNHQVDPSRFRFEEGHYIFIPTDVRMRAVSTWFTRRPFAIPCWIPLMLLQEERSISVAQECLKAKNQLEPSFYNLPRMHLADEIDHLRWGFEIDRASVAADPDMETPTSGAAFRGDHRQVFHHSEACGQSSVAGIDRRIP